MRVLIVGYGYVGQAVGAALALQGHAVAGLRRSRPDPALARDVAGHIELGDITRPESLTRLPNQYDWVVHCVSSGGGTPDAYRAVYLEGTKNLLAWLRGAPPQKLVYTSSTSVYGQIDGEWVHETSPTLPATETGRILLETERLLLERGATILRVGGIYGPGRGYWLKQFLAGHALEPAQKDRFVNMIHRDDVAGAVRAALERGRPGRIYNAVDNEPVTPRVLFDWLGHELNRPVPAAIATEVPPASKRGISNKRVSNQRLRTELGYVFQYPTFREGFKPLL